MKRRSAHPWTRRGWRREATRWRQRYAEASRERTQALRLAREAEDRAAELNYRLANQRKLRELAEEKLREALEGRVP